MIKLNLEINNEADQRIKNYLERNASEILAEKINNGVKIIKENKTLINKKTLSGFMKYASDEARKLAEKGANFACIEDEVVYGWAIHYFEEESIEGNLYNEDGSEFKVAPKITTTPKPQPKKEPPKEENKQATLFDFFDTNINDEPEKNIENKKDEIDIIEEVKEDNLIQKQDLIIDTETGEVLTENKEINAFDDEVTTSLFSIFENTLEVK